MAIMKKIIPLAIATYRTIIVSSLIINYAGGFLGRHSKKTSSSPFFGVEVSTIMTK